MTVQEEWREAWRELGRELAKALGLIAIVNWLTVRGDYDPFCWCGHAKSRHERRYRDRRRLWRVVPAICDGCWMDAQPDDEADPMHDFEEAIT
jgi:hypothetical protein